MIVAYSNESRKDGLMIFAYSDEYGEMIISCREEQRQDDLVIFAYSNE